MKRFLFLLSVLAIPCLAVAADINPTENRPGVPGIYINKKLRDMGDGTYAPTVDAPATYSFSYMTSTTTVKTSAGILHCVTITDAAAQAFTIYDSTFSAGTSTVIADFESNAANGTYCFDVLTTNGIQVNMPASGPDITVSYR